MDDVSFVTARAERLRRGEETDVERGEGDFVWGRSRVEVDFDCRSSLKLSEEIIMQGRWMIISPKSKSE